MKIVFVLFLAPLLFGCGSEPKEVKDAFTGYADNLRDGVDKAQDAAQKAEERMQKNMEQLNQVNEQ